jgi:membrane associated rhomboid family serine protease
MDNYIANFISKLDIKGRIMRFLRSKNPTNRLIIANVCIYLLVLSLNEFSKTLLFLHNISEKDVVNDFVLNWFGVSSNFETLITRPWTLLTSTFLHLEFFHILFNMIMLWLAGWVFTKFIAPKQIYWVYLLGGIVGSLSFILSFNYFPVFESIVANSTAIGASDGVLAVLIAATTKVPNYPVRLVYIKIRLKWVAVALVVLDIISIPHGNSGGHFAHLGGALFGFLFILIPVLKQKIRTSIPQKEPKHRPKTDEQYNAERAKYRKQVDKILDKVAKSGYDNLNKEEKDFLFNTSKKKNW